MFTKKSLIFILFLAALLSFVLCSKNPADSKEGVYHGMVKLLPGTDYSNMVVSLYEMPAMDSVIIAARSKWPQLAFAITERDLFDHRELTPIKQTIANSSGAWKIEAPKATYCLVAAKEGYGWNYLFDVSPGMSVSQTLLAEITLNANIQDAISLQRDQHYIVDRDLTILAGGSLTMDGGAWLRLNSGVDITCEGSLFVAGVPGNLARITSNDSRLSNSDWNAIKLTNCDNISIIGAKIGYGSNSVSIKNCRSTLIKNCIFHDAQYAGILLNQANECEISQNLFIENTEGVLCMASQNVIVKNNIFVKNDQGMESEESVVDIYNNMIRQNDMGLHSQYRPSPTIHNNEFSENDNGIFCAGSGPVIKLNNFVKNNIGIYIGTEYSSIDSDPVIRQNNFNDKTYAIKLKGDAGGANIIDVMAFNNYWSTANSTKINDIIWDRADAALDSLYTGRVMYHPYHIIVVDSAGIRNQP